MIDPHVARLRALMAQADPCVWKLYHTCREAAECLDDAVIDPLLRLLEHKRPLVRMGAVMGLARWYVYARVREALQMQNALETSPGVKIAIADARCAPFDENANFEDVQRRIRSYAQGAQWRAMQGWANVCTLDYYDMPISGFSITGDGKLWYWKSEDWVYSTVIFSVTPEQIQSHLERNTPTTREMMLGAAEIYRLRYEGQDIQLSNVEKLDSVPEDLLPLGDTIQE